MDIEFEWDENKNKLNKKNHKLSFETATLAFADEFSLEDIDYKNSTEEEIRYKMIAKIPNTYTVLVIIYTERNGKTRIISARKATPKEAKKRNEK